MTAPSTPPTQPDREALTRVILNVLLATEAYYAEEHAEAAADAVLALLSSTPPAPDREALTHRIALRFANVSNLPDWMQVAALGRDMTPLGELAADALLAAGTPTETDEPIRDEAVASLRSCSHPECGDYCDRNQPPPPAEDTAASTLCSKDHVAGTRVGECDKCFMYLAGAADQARSMRQHGWTPPSEDTDTLRAAVEAERTEGDWLAESLVTVTAQRDDLRARIEAACEQIRLTMLARPSTERRDTYSDGFGQGLAYALDWLRPALSPPVRDEGNDR